MYERILVPTDGSDHAIRAAEHALWLSRSFDATLHVINVDLVAMGTAGRTGLGRFVLGSTAETVVNRAEMPVFSVTASDRES